ncbi:MAG: hypothetical protein ACE5G1_03965 [bacterium]
MRTRDHLVLAGLFAVSFAAALTASTPKIITFRTQRDFEKGEPKGISINSYGEITLAPQIKEVFDSDLAFIWSLTSDSQGNVFTAGGNGGKVFRVDSGQEATAIFEAESVEIYALAVDANNNLFVASSPKGKVYKVPLGTGPQAADAVFFDPESVYIWSMALDRSGNLFVATGEPGVIYKVDREGNGTVFYESDDAHIRKIIFDAAGNLLAGTAEKGMILRIDPSGKAFVLYDSPLTEVTALEQDRFGNIYAAISGEALHRTPPSAPKPASTRSAAEGAADENEENEVLDLPSQDLPAANTRRGTSRGSKVFRIDKDGLVRSFWSAPRERIYTMLFDNAGNLIVGSGDKGRLYSVLEDGEHTLLSQLEELQVTALHKAPDNSIYLGASNGGKLYRIDTQYSPKGEYLSEVIDAQVISQWGAISWEAELGSGTRLVFYSRSGNTQEPDKTWSDWSPGYSVSSGQSISSPSARFLQIKAELSTRNRSVSPKLTSVSFSYLQKNVAPQITEITVHKPGDYYPDSNKKSSDDDDFGNGNSAGHNGFQTRSIGRKTYKKGFRSVSWRTIDDNHDQLSYQLFYRGENENSWKTLAKDLRGNVYSWDSELFPDGRYFIKIVARDDISNPPAMVLSTTRVGQPFVVDNSGPTVSGITVRSRGDETVLTFTVEDQYMSILSVEYGLNAEKWRLVYPVDGICDSKKEQFEIKLTAPPKGTNSIVVKALDSLRNVGFGKSNFTR